LGNNILGDFFANSSGHPRLNNDRKSIRPLQTRDARWFVFKPKIPIWVNFAGSCNSKCWYILCPFGLFLRGHWKYFVVIWYILWSFGIFCGHLVYFVVIWYILWSFGIFCGHLVHFPRVGMLYQEKSGNPASNNVLLAPKFFFGFCQKKVENVF
jgi:hypothetical protein